jgi:hypothetical protein
MMNIRKAASIVLGVFLIQIAPSSFGMVKYKDLENGDILYTRGCSKPESTAWISRFKVTSIDNKGIAWGTFERATIRDRNFRSLNFLAVQDQKINLTEVCQTGGCYTNEEEPFADAKKWMVHGCTE